MKLEISIIRKTGMLKYVPIKQGTLNQPLGQVKKSQGKLENANKMKIPRGMQQRQCSEANV